MQMDTLKSQKLKARKTKVIAQKSTVQILSNLFFRSIEVTVVVITVAKLFYQIILTFENSGERFKGLAFILANRHVAFFVGNAIVIALFSKYSQFPNQESNSRSTSNRFYEDFVKESRGEEKDSWAEVMNKGKQNIKEDEDRNEINTKHIITSRLSFNEIEGLTENKAKQIITVTKQQCPSENRQKKSYVRSWSENMENTKVNNGRIRRSKTERFDGVNEGMSNDELRNKIESFIARQRRNQKDEEFCIT